MTHRKLAEKLFLKAEQDWFVLKKLKDQNVANEILGFHAQQATEKMLKAVIASCEVKYPFTPRIAELIDCITDQGIDFPSELDDVRLLTPFAVEFRYDFIDDEEDDLNINPTIELLEKLRDWVKNLIAV